MKKLLPVILAVGLGINLKAQTNYINVCADCNNLDHTFDFNLPTDSTNYFFLIDTSQLNNLWQLGVPSKEIFTSGYWGPKTFVTDTINPYSINNISSFQFSMLNCSWMTKGDCGGYQVLFINIITKVNSDSTKDGGTIEVSHNGSPWINIISDTLAYIVGDIYSAADTILSMNKPGYSGISNSWNQINVYFNPEMVELYDTLTLRFTFSSDSIQTNKDGWNIGVIQMGGIFEGIEEIEDDNLISIYPNPTDGTLKVKRTKVGGTTKVQIFEYTGRLVCENLNFSGETIETQYLPNGIYLLRYSDAKNFSIKKFVVQH